MLRRFLNSLYIITQVSADFKPYFQLFSALLQNCRQIRSVPINFSVQSCQRRGFMIEYKMDYQRLRQVTFPLTTDH